MKFIVCLFLFLPVLCLGEDQKSQGHQATAAKKQTYVANGFFLGGDNKIKTIAVQNIRRAQSSEGFERIVFDLESEGIPYFQAQAAPDEHRLVVSFWATVDYKINPEKVQKNFARSKHIKNVHLVPKIENNVSVVELQLKKNGKLEAFYLTNPNRIILDIL